MWIFKCVKQKQIFVAPHQRIEEKKEQQHKMEKAFEDLYMTATGNFLLFVINSMRISGTSDAVGILCASQFTSWLYMQQFQQYC